MYFRVLGVFCVAGREYDEAGVLGILNDDCPIDQTTFYTQLQRIGYHTTMTGKDDINKKTQLRSRIGKYLPCAAATYEVLTLHLF